jgi:hypothetical protein
MGSLFSTYPVLTRIRRKSVTPPANARTCWSNPYEPDNNSNCVMVLAKREGATVTARQGRRAAAQPGTTIQVLPFGVGAHPGIDGEFVSVDYPDPEDDPFVYEEGPVRGCLHREPEDIARYRLASTTQPPTWRCPRMLPWK